MPPDDSSIEQSRRLVYLAAERTLTSWIRTALSLMSLGFVIDRFDLVLRQMLGTRAGAETALHPEWQWSGELMIGVGVLMAVAAAVHYLRFAHQYRRDRTTDVGRSLEIGSVFTFVLAGVGLLVLVVLTRTMR